MRSFGTLLARSVSASQLQGAGFDRELGLPTRRFSTCPCGFPPDSVSLAGGSQTQKFHPHSKDQILDLNGLFSCSLRVQNPKMECFSYWFQIRNKEPFEEPLKNRVGLIVCVWCSEIDRYPILTPRIDSGSTPTLSRMKG